MTMIFGAEGVQPTLRGQASNLLSIPAGGSYIIPAGTWDITVGPYTGIQEYDPITTIWRAIGNDGQSVRYQNSDGVNFRVANQTGTVVGAQVTTAGTGYTSRPTITDNGGSATYLPLIGGLINTSITITNGGRNYTYPPIVTIDAPPSPGVQATATCTISSGAVNAITVVNQGAGYANAPGVYFTNDPRDVTGTNAAATSTLTGAGTIAAIVVTNNGTAVSSVPTLTFSGGGGSSGAATALMDFTTTAYTVTSAGSGYVGNVLITGLGGTPSAALSSYTNPAIQTGLVRTRPAFYGGALSSTGVTTAGQTLYDGGAFAGVPTGYVAGYTGTTNTSAALVSFTVGGVTDTVLILAV